MSTVLVVDDSRIDQRLVGHLLEKSTSLEIEYAANGREALERIRKKAPDLVVTDLFMPEMDGMQLLAVVGRDHPLVPVVLMTSSGSEEIAAQAERFGARAYVPKAALGRLLPGIVEQLLTLCREKRELNRLLHSMTESESTFMLRDNDTQFIGPLLEYVNGCLRSAGICDEGGEDMVCLALEEALRNAVHHGNLELGSDLRSLEDDEVFNRVMEERRRTPPYCDRNVTVRISISAQRACFVIRDDGPGFDPNKLPDPTTPENLEAVCGRGVWLMRSLMDEVRYNTKGNEVTLIKHAVRG
jgi:CheY-like chemotaxis protein